MLSVKNSLNASWRTPLMNVIGTGNDMERFAVRRAFDAGIAWAQANNILDKNRTEHPCDQYFRTRNSPGGPIIPRFMRAYCAHKLSLQCVEAAPTYGLELANPPEEEEEELIVAVRKPPQKPAPRPRLSSPPARSFA